MINVGNTFKSVAGRVFKAKRFNRAFERKECFLQANLHFVDRDFTEEGFINEISRGGARFHPARTHILNRSGDDVLIQFGGIEFEAKIMKTYEEGYGLKLNHLIPEELLETLIEDAAVKQQGYDLF